jgi:hypothetical protein
MANGKPSIPEGKDPMQILRIDPTKQEVSSMSNEQRERVVRYMENAPLVLRAPGLIQDVVEPALGKRVPVGFHSDGSWVWPAAATYYLRNHSLSLPAVFTDHVLAMGSPPDELSRAAEVEALELLGVR